MSENKIPKEDKQNPLKVFANKVEQFNQVQNNNIAKSEQLTQEIKVIANQIIQMPNNVLNAHTKGLRATEATTNKLRELALDLSKDIETTITEATKKVQGVEISLNEKDRKTLADTNKNYKNFKTFFLIISSICFFSALVALGGLYMSKDWYNTSVRTKQEVRAELLNEISSKGDVIVSDAYLSALQNEKQMLKGWVESNPDDSKSYNTHRKAIINIDGNKEVTFFKSATSDEMQKGGRKGLFN